MQGILKELDQIELMILIYSDRDRDRMKQLEKKKYDLEQILLDMMVMDAK